MDKTRIFETAGKFAAKGQFEKAAKEYQRVLEKDPKDVRALQKLAEIHQRNGQLKDAADLLLKVAEGYSEQGFFLKAVAVYKQILKFGDDDRIDVNLKLAQLYQQLGLVSDATSQHLIIANYYDRIGNARESLAAVRRMVDLDPDNVASRVKLGELYAREQMTADAVAEFKRAASYLRKNSRTEDQQRVLERIAQLAPDDAVVAKELAQLHLAQGDTKRALARLQVCFRQNPRDVETLTLLAQAFDVLGQTAKTVSVYRELAHVHRESGQGEAERRVLEKLLALVPDDTEALNALDRLSGVEPPAAPMPTISVDVPDVVVEEAPAKAPEPPAPPEPPKPPPGRVRTGLGAALPPPAGTTPAVTKVLTEVDVYLKYGLVPKAEEHLRQALASDPESIALHERLVTLLDKREQSAEAEATVAKLVLLARAGADKSREAAYLQELGQRAPNHELVVEANAAAQLGGDDEDFDDLVIEPDEHELASAAIAAEVVHSEAPIIDTVIVDELGDGVVFEPDEIIDENIDGDVAFVDESDVTFVDDGELVEDEETIFAADAAAFEDAPPAFAETNAPDEQLTDASSSVLDSAQTAAALHDDWGGLDDVAAPRTETETAFAEEPVVFDDSSFPETRADVFAADEDPFGSFSEDEWSEAPPSETQATPEPEHSFTADFDASSTAPVELFEEELEEADFLLQQGLVEDARYALEGILAQAPEHEKAHALLRSLAPPEQTAPPPAVEAPVRSGGFDLAAELADEFDFIDRSESTPGGFGDPVSFGDVLGEFVEQRPESVSSEDSQTHYDLGIAYKEMGLLDEAIHEFEVALGGTGTRRIVDSLTMLGICLLAKKEPQSAIEQFKKALQTPGLTIEGSKEAHFQIGLAQESLGNVREAFGHFARVFKADPGFRNVREKVIALRALARAAPPQASTADGKVLGRVAVEPGRRAAEQPTSSPSLRSNRGKIGFL